MDEKKKLKVAMNAIFAAMATLEILFRDRDQRFPDEDVRDCFYEMNHLWLCLHERSDQLETGDK